MKRALYLAYGLLAYVLFLGVFGYAVGFVEDILVPKSIDSGTGSFGREALMVNLGLLGLFGLQHSIMARPAFKRWWTRFVPTQIERSTFVLATNAILVLLFWQWRPMNEVVWHVEGWPAVVLLALSYAGFGLVLVSTFVIDHFDLFGLRQVILYARGIPYSPPPYQESLTYRLVRHPLMLGFFVAFWSAPHMSLGRLLFCTVVTTWVLLTLQLEERDLMQAHGEAYRAYRRRVPMILPVPRLTARRARLGLAQPDAVAMSTRGPSRNMGT